MTALARVDTADDVRTRLELVRLSAATNAHDRRPGTGTTTTLPSPANAEAATELWSEE